mmetsp:Transcript_29151/g.73267  ORF Transcript_29151/g.73267 Transcript_29151/m.73267 type:complete len:119 (-) Transcript_29151:82-438(-)
MAACYCSQCDGFREMETIGESSAEAGDCCLSRDTAKAMRESIICETSTAWFKKLLERTGAGRDEIPSKKRELAYKLYVAEKMGALGKGVRVNLPICVKGAIRVTFPSNNERYMGFMEN